MLTPQPPNPPNCPYLTPLQKAPLGVSWGQFVQPVSIPRFICIICAKLSPNRSSSLTTFPSLLNCWPHKCTQTAALGYRGRIVFSLCPFPDESTDVYQIWCQSVQPMTASPPPRLLNLWPLTHPPTHPPDMPPGVLRGALYLAYAHSQMNPQTWTKVGANRPSRLTASPDFWMFDPLKPPKCLLVSLGAIYLAYIHSQMNLPMCTKFGANRSSSFTSSPDFWICDP